MSKEKYYAALVIRAIDNDEGKMTRYCECISDKDESVVDDNLVKLSQERMVSKSAPSYFYRRAEGQDYFDAVGKCVEEIEDACRKDGIDPSKIQGLYDLSRVKGD